MYSLYFMFRLCQLQTSEFLWGIYQIIYLFDDAQTETHLKRRGLGQAVSRTQGVGLYLDEEIKPVEESNMR